MVLKNLFTGQQWGNRHREHICRHEERGGEGKIFGESNMKTYITLCKIDSQCNLLYGSGKSNRGSISTSRGGMGK